MTNIINFWSGQTVIIVKTKEDYEKLKTISEIFNFEYRKYFFKITYTRLLELFKFNYPKEDQRLGIIIEYTNSKGFTFGPLKLYENGIRNGYFTEILPISKIWNETIKIKEKVLQI